MEEIFRRRELETKQEDVEGRIRIRNDALASLRRSDRDPDNYIACAELLSRLGWLGEALDVIKRSLARCEPLPLLYELHIELLSKCNRTREAIAVARQATRLFPGDDLFFRLKGALLLPILYDTQEEVNYYRKRFGNGLRLIGEELRLETASSRQRALAAIQKHVNFYLGYQNRNDRELQQAYGNLVHRIVSANFPMWSEQPHMPAWPDDGRLRIGYISNFFHTHSVTRMFLGWLRGHDPGRFSVFNYHVGKGTDAVTEQVRRSSFVFRQLPKDFDVAATAIRNDDLHVLVFLDIGMSRFISVLAALRLAPIQCMSWGHPITSGLPTIRYFISSDLMEPIDAQEHYSERLVRLPGIGSCYSKPVIPEPLLNKTRRDFGLREDSVVYLSCQSIFKYLPEQDRVFAKIARRVLNAQIVFLAMNDIVQNDFQKRLTRAFDAEGLRAADHCVVLLRVSHFDFWCLIRNADIVLDTIGWSGGISTFEVVACGLPLVTMPGKFMRGRQSSAILGQLGTHLTIARDTTQYVEIAVRLSRDARLRQEVVDQTIKGHANLYSDTRCITALEEFYQRAVLE